ncbi:exodeoxyribonuclease VII large subunit [Aliishimia ponticola]|uniref:Exodeoxyribonuclease 7 large subunit n=1 Tax=Aliishimia ponticola TaxID=2499833 RepID=A0A4S4NF14_9RHOB|nr:exodeoxyribonuclease VII large subunit [Aliishimia ponticola]THH37385.1 exodeoxyribonuclease VII large subunit [Aliishimia ponticola]
MDLIDDPVPGQNTPEYTVSEISGAVKRTLEDEFGRIRVKGEVGRVVRARSGHMYFDVKDDRSSLACTTWKGQVARLAVVPEEGMEVVVTGRMTAYGAQSKYNMNVDEVTVAGQGALMALLEKRKKALEAEGLFAAERKKPLPFLPEVIGVVTSLQGAVIRDILHRLRDRFPRKVLIWPVAVQGTNCAPEVERAIKGFNAMTPGGALPRPDLLIVARGGGSIEDLWGFNEEIVARAAAASEIPLISAVGHETDTTLIDFVSDRRAPTPTAAAEMAVPVRLDLMAWLREANARLGRGLAAVLDRRGQRLQDLSRALPSADRLLEAPRQRLDRADRLEAALQSVVHRRRGALAEAGAGLRPQVLTAGLRQRRADLTRVGDRLQPVLAARVARQSELLSAKLRSFRPQMLARDVAERRKALEDRTARLAENGATRLRRLSDRLEALDRLRQTLGYEATLQRGYAVVWDGDTVITGKAAAEKADSLQIQFADGRVEVGGKPAATSAQRKASKPKPPEQGSLF